MHKNIVNASDEDVLDYLDFLWGQCKDLKSCKMVHDVIYGNELNRLLAAKYNRNFPATSHMDAHCESCVKDFINAVRDYINYKNGITTLGFDAWMEKNGRTLKKRDKTPIEHKKEKQI